jgi:hypothetical protein
MGHASALDTCPVPTSGRRPAAAEMLAAFPGAPIANRPAPAPVWGVPALKVGRSIWGAHRRSHDFLQQDSRHFLLRNFSGGAPDLCSMLRAKLVYMCSEKEVLVRSGIDGSMLALLGSVAAVIATVECMPGP